MSYMTSDEGCARDCSTDTRAAPDFIIQRGEDEIPKYGANSPGYHVLQPVKEALQEFWWRFRTCLHDIYLLIQDVSEQCRHYKKVGWPTILAGSTAPICGTYDNGFAPVANRSTGSHRGELRACFLGHKATARLYERTDLCPREPQRRQPGAAPLECPKCRPVPCLLAI